MHRHSWFFSGFLHAALLTFTAGLVDCGGGHTSETSSPKDVDLSDRTFTLGVCLQGASKVFDGKTVAQNYKDLGINTFAGLWNWPYETLPGAAAPWTYPGYTLDVAESLYNAGMKAYGGSDQAAVDWINDPAHAKYKDTVIGYFLGDEPDMKRNSGVPAAAAANTPLAWHATGDALLAAKAAIGDTRPIWANFGKPFAKDAWYGTENGSTGSKTSDFEHYVAPTSVISSDLYGITDPWELPENHGVWTYGRSVRNTAKYAGTRPVWGLVETSAPWTQASSSNWMFQRMPSTLVMPIVWNMVVNGAQGILYFCHDMSPASVNKGAFATLLEPEIPEAMKAANESVMAFGAVLKSPSLPGTTASTDGSVNVITLTKSFGGSTYIFAMADGNANFPTGKSVDADIQVSETRTGSVEVLNDSRTITMTNGKISEHFEPYELHIYRY